VYLQIQFAVIALLLLGLASFNFAVDPYGIYSPEKSYTFNEHKTEFFLKEPFIKPYRVSDMQLDTVILGMSQVGLGYDENHPYFAKKSVYNFSMAGASMYMVYRAFQHASIESELQSVFLDLNMLNFNEYDPFVVRNDNSVVSKTFEGLLAVKEDGSRNWMAPFRQLTHIPLFLLSQQAVKDSLATIKMQEALHEGWYLNSKGGWRGSTLAPEQSQGKRFLNIAKYLVNGYLRGPAVTHQFSIYKEDGSLSRAFEYYERLLDEAYRNNVNVTLVLSPNHIYFYEALDSLGLETMFLDWKRKMVLTNAEVASRYGRTPFPVWDFAHYSALTTETVPAKGDKARRMKWFYDPLHFTRVAGDLVLDQVYLDREGSGVAVTAENLDGVLEMQRQNKQEFQRENVELIVRLKAMYSEFAK
jgi:hypothetical protein